MNLDIVHFYADKGWQVFPLKPKDKIPACKWADVATSEKNQLTGLFEFSPNANIGIATGKRSGITVLDVDASHDGYESLAELLAEYGALPETPVAKTGGGGEHIFFNYVPGTRNSAGKLGRGLDIRSDGGYVVGAGSVHPSGTKYEWVVLPSKTPLADMPQWMVELLAEKEAAPAQEVATNIISGERNNALTKVAGSMRRKGHSEAGITAALLVYNQEHCNPPLSEREVMDIARSVTRYEPQDVVKVKPPLPSSDDVLAQIVAEVNERKTNPKQVWGIHYAWPYLSLITGGKQKGELIIVAGEPGVGKSWWCHQDALFTALGSGAKNIPATPTLLWSGEMSRRQVYRRMLEMLGVPKRNMLTGKMSAHDDQMLEESVAILNNIPLYVADMPLDLNDIRPMLEREIGEHGVEQVLFDYDWLINAPGRDEIATSQAISREMKNLARELNISILLISSVNKGGMDSVSENTTKSSVSGSGKKLHDADVIYILTKFNEKKNNDMSIMPADYDRISTLHIAKGRELDFHVPGGAINYMRESPNPKFRELKDLNAPNALPSWIDRKDIG